MKFIWQRNIFKSTIVCALFTATPMVLAQTFDYSLLVGEWGLSGTCDTSRYVYTADGKYTVLEKKADNSWQTSYEGLYEVKPETDLVVIAEGEQQGGFGFSTVELTEQSYISYEVIPGESQAGNTFEYTKCPSRS